ncbi:MAG: F-type H+-transporting ATPase subunit a [Planctomycetota bacterium]|jgi:F-type H+-transporting ATPase subunit a
MFAFLSSEVTDPIQWIFIHNMDDAMGPLGISKLTLNMWLAAGILTFLLWKVKKDQGAPTGLLRGIFEMVYFFVRDGIVYPVMGKENGQTFLPLFLTMFSFIFTMNLMGLVPLPYIGGAATGTLGLTISLASIVFLTSVLAGIKYNGIGGFITGFLPHGLPKFVIPLLFPIEVLGFVIKHAVLAVRLFANMLAGHLVLGGFLGLIFVYESYALVPVSIPLALFMNFLELLVAFLQAYVFTLLSCLFIGGAVHPDH